MKKHSNVIVIGAGQAGLSVSYCLTRHDIKHLIIEQGRVADTWLTKRWDSFTMVSPNLTIRLPGFHYCGDNPDGYFSGKEFADYLKRYAASFGVPIQHGVRVTSLESNSNSKLYLRTDRSNGSIEADVVVVATGGYQKPRRPSFTSKLPQQILQISPEEYRNPSELPLGAVLVVGSGQSGAQIAEELHQAGKTVFLAVGSTGRWPRRYRGKDVNVWLMEIDDKNGEVQPPPKPRLDSNPHVSGRNGGHDINLRELGLDGVILLGHIYDIEGHIVKIANDLEENLLKADERAASTKRKIDEFIEREGLDFPKETSSHDIRPGEGTPNEPIQLLDLQTANVSAVIWATGYKLDFDWIRVPVLGEDSFPLHTRGVSIIRGLYFLGLPWLSGSNSSGVIGVGEDAVYLADHIAASYV